MKLIKISARGFKGRDAFSHDLAPMTLFYGGNFCGKTRVMDAVRLALLGHLPELGKTNEATFGLASGTSMGVTAEFDNGLKVVRAWTLVGNSVKKIEEIPDEFKALGDLSVMLNAESYFGLSDRARVDYVFAHCPAPSLSDADKADVLVRLLALSNDDNHNTTVMRIHEAALHDEQEQERSMPAYIESLIEGAAEEWKGQKLATVRAEKMIQQLTAMRLGDDPTASITVVEQRRATLSAELAVLAERKGGAIGGYERMKADARRRAEITRELSAGDQATKDRVSFIDSLATLVERGDAESLVTIETIQEAQAAVTAVTRELDEARRLKAEARGRWQEADKTLTDIERRTTCPYCGAVGEGWKALKVAELTTLVDQGITLVANYEKLIQTTEEQLAGAQEKKERMVLKLGEQRQLQEKKDQLVAKIAALDTQLARLLPLVEERGRLAVDDAQLTAEVATIQTELNVKNDELRALDREVKVLSGRQFELKRLADAEAERDTAKAAADYAAVLGKELRVIQGETVERAFKPLLERANSFFGDVLLSPIAYHDGEIGTWREGQWVGHRTFSGTEKALTYAAIQAALAMRSPLRLMLLDELGRVDELHLEGLLDAVAQAVADGRVDGFVGIDVAVKDRDGDLRPRRALAMIPSLQVTEIV